LTNNHYKLIILGISQSLLLHDEQMFPFSG